MEIINVNPDRVTQLGYEGEDRVTVLQKPQDMMKNQALCLSGSTPKRQRQLSVQCLDCKKCTNGIKIKHKETNYGLINFFLFSHLLDFERMAISCGG